MVAPNSIKHKATHQSKRRIVRSTKDFAATTHLFFGQQDLCLCQPLVTGESHTLLVPNLQSSTDLPWAVPRYIGYVTNHCVSSSTKAPKWTGRSGANRARCSRVLWSLPALLQSRRDVNAARRGGDETRRLRLRGHAEKSADLMVTSGEHTWKNNVNTKQRPTENRQSQKRRASVAFENRHLTYESNGKNKNNRPDETTNTSFCAIQL